MPERSGAILDRGGLSDTTIFASGNIDEFQLADLISQNAPIDGFGIGTRLDTSADAPYLDCAYKLQEYAGMARRKRSEGKATWPGRKQVYRQYHDNGEMYSDTVTLADAPCSGLPLLEPVMQCGTVTANRPGLLEIRAYTRNQLQSLPEALRKLSDAPDYPVTISAELRTLAKQIDEQIP